MYYVYYLQSLKFKQRFYTGFTSNLRIRFKQHNNGLVLSTRPYRPWRVIFCEVYISKVDAQRREKYLKTTIGKRALRLILRNTLTVLINS